MRFLCGLIFLMISLFSFSEQLIKSTQGRVFVNENSNKINEQLSFKNVKSIILPSYNLMNKKSDYNLAYKYLRNNKNIKKIIFLASDNVTNSNGFFTTDSETLLTDNSYIDIDLNTTKILLSKKICKLNTDFVDFNYDLITQLPFFDELFGKNNYKIAPIVVGNNTNENSRNFSNNLKNIVDEFTLIIGIGSKKSNDNSSVKFIIKHIFNELQLVNKKIVLEKNKNKNIFSEFFMKKELNGEKSKENLLKLTKKDLKALDKIAQNTIINYLCTKYINNYQKKEINEKYLTKNLKSHIPGLTINLYTINKLKKVLRSTCSGILSDLPLYKQFDKLLNEALLGDKYFKEIELHEFYGMEIEFVLLKDKMINDYNLIDNDKDIVLLNYQGEVKVTRPKEYINKDFNVRERLKKMCYNINLPLLSFEKIDSQLMIFNSYYSNKLKPSKLVLKKYVWKFRRSSYFNKNQNKKRSDFSNKRGGF